jgi:hypothetical protein
MFWKTVFLGEDDAFSTGHTLFGLQVNCHCYRYRSTEATAKLVAVSVKWLLTPFSGSFCYSCAVEAYFEDVICPVKRLADKVGLDILEVW